MDHVRYIWWDNYNGYSDWFISKLNQQFISNISKLDTIVNTFGRKIKKQLLFWNYACPDVNNFEYYTWVNIVIDTIDGSIELFLKY